MRKGFTLIELVVAVALLSMVLSFAGVIFNVSIESHRTASANAEIMRKLRAITDQLNTDFAGIRTEAPLLISFEQEPGDPNQRYDQIMFFANGDFQSIQTYEANSIVAGPDPEGDLVVRGNVARVYYGQADNRSLLARRQHILTADDRVEDWPDVDMSNFGFRDNNEELEHDTLSLAEWKTVDAGDYDTIVEVCFETRPDIDMDDPNTYHKLMCEGVGSFAIQWAYWDEDDERFYWFPSDDPDGDGSDRDSHFDDMPDEFGVLFNVPGTPPIAGWEFIEDEDVRYGSGDEDKFSANFYPKALKFTFRLYDSRGIIGQDGEKGREFTHIVYLGG